MVGMVRNEPITKMPVRAEIMPRTSAVTAAYFFFGASTGAPYAGCTAGACWVNCGCCGAAGCGVFSDMKVLISYVVGEYPEAHHLQVAYLSQGYSMCLKALTS